MFDAATQKVEQKLGELTHVDIEHASAGNKLRFAAVVALGAGAVAIAEHFHVPKKLVIEGASEIAKVTGAEEVATIAKATKSANDDLPVGEWLKRQPKPMVAKILSPQVPHAEKLAARLHTAFRQDGDIIGNVERALNEHSAEFFPYVKPLSIKMAAEDDAFMDAHGGDIYLHGKLERTASGDVEMEYKSTEMQGESGLAAAFGHEYNHVEQSHFVPYTFTSESITEAEYQRRIRLQDSIQRNNSVELPMLTAENDWFALRAINSAGKKAMMDAGAIPVGKPAEFTQFYRTVTSIPADEIPHSYQSFLDRQKAISSAISPPLSEHDLGRQMFIVLRGQIATTQARALMTYKLYGNLYHETEAFQLEDAIKGAYGNVHK